MLVFIWRLLDDLRVQNVSLHLRSLRKLAVFETLTGVNLLTYAVIGTYQTGEGP
jgi:hypothetical protein